MTTYTKYLLFQIPGWVLFTLILIGVWHWIGIPLWIALILWVLWIAKDFAFYPFLRSAYESKVQTGPEQLVGIRGVARDHLKPCGYVMVRGELWRAEAVTDNLSIPPGTPIRVQGAEGLTLKVTLDDGPSL